MTAFIINFLEGVNLDRVELEKWKRFFYNLKSCGGLLVVNMQDINPKQKTQKHLLLSFFYKDNDVRYFEISFQNKHLHVKVFEQWLNTYNNQTLIINLLKNQLFKR